MVQTVVRTGPSIFKNLLQPTTYNLQPASPATANNPQPRRHDTKIHETSKSVDNPTNKEIMQTLTQIRSELRELRRFVEGVDRANRQRGPEPTIGGGATTTRDGQMFSPGSGVLGERPLSDTAKAAIADAERREREERREAEKKTCQDDEDAQGVTQ